MKLEDVNIKDVTPMMKQYIEIKRNNKDVILFFRLGDFYEMFFEDATLVSHELELVLTGKSAGLKEKIPMCGIPYHASDVYINKLINKGYKIAICEQLEDASLVKGLVKRGIVKIVSSGTILSTSALEETSNNYIGALTNNIFTYLDLTTGDIISTKLDNIVSEIVSLNIKEVVMTNNNDISNSLKNNNILISFYNPDSLIDNYSYVYKNVKDEKIINNIKYLLSYVNLNIKEDMNHIKTVIIKNKSNNLIMNIHTKRNLELTETLRNKERMHSLLWLLDKTKTAMGSRTLKRNIEEPITDINLLTSRYDYIDSLMTNFIDLEDLKSLLYEIYDLERLSGRISTLMANGRDLVQLKKSIAKIPLLKELLVSTKFYKEINFNNDLYEFLDKSIYEEPPITLKEGYLIKEGYNTELDELKTIRKSGKKFVVAFENSEKERTGIKSLKVGYNRVFGYYIEIPKGSIKDVKEEFGYERRQTLADKERYISPVLKEKESLILNAEERIIKLEYDLFCDIRSKVKEYIKDIQELADIISEVDMLQSLASVASLNNYVRPTLTDKHIIDIKEGRHPVVEKVINDPYISNDIYMDENTDILLITGPNMAGKSTYMRELAIIAIMAQIGSFVPAKKAILPIFDQIFTRIGASDDLVSGESTFMVEMNDANYAINNATSKSLILFDELGRGTSTFDGMALAQAVIEYISINIKAKTLFSTHYHELTDLDSKLDNLKNVHVKASYENNELIFLHKVEEGSVDKSYGIHVAALAKLPNSLIKRALAILEVYEKKEIKRDKEISKEEIIIDNESKIKNLIKDINLNKITPIEALNILDTLKKEVE